MNLKILHHAEGNRNRFLYYASEHSSGNWMQWIYFQKVTEEQEFLKLRLLAENRKEDKEIKRLEKLLKLGSKEKVTCTKFKADGLDCIFLLYTTSFVICSSPLVVGCRFQTWLGHFVMFLDKKFYSDCFFPPRSINWYQ